jgi:hypothetical protein
MASCWPILFQELTCSSDETETSSKSSFAGCCSKDLQDSRTLDRSLLSLTYLITFSINSGARPMSTGLGCDAMMLFARRQLTR